jgi:anti-repressor protein
MNNILESMVQLVNGQPVTSSINVAQVFGKPHKNVLQAIENLDCSEEFRRLNFQPATYLDAQGKPRPMFFMTQDGWVFLVMAFTGKKAAQFKERYIAAFNQMKKRLERSTLTEKDMVRGYLAKIEENERLEAECKALWSKAQLSDAFLTASNDAPVAVFAKSAKLIDAMGKPYPLGPNRMFKLLRELGYLFKREGYNLPKQEYIDRGIFRVIETTVTINGKPRITPVVRVTPKGHEWLLEKISKHLGLYPAIADNSTGEHLSIVAMAASELGTSSNALV